tara:strand:- start:16 stop:135 length:120 start_codon:yes stop_codon:yes gene_type:complete
MIKKAVIMIAFLIDKRLKNGMTRFGLLLLINLRGGENAK